MPAQAGVLSIKQRRRKFMPMFRTKVREVEAFQFKGQPVEDWPLWAQDPRYLAVSGTGLYAYTKSGPVRVSRGDWLIAGDSEIYPCTDEEFQKRYEPICGTEG